MKGFMGWTNDEIVSVDLMTDPISSMFDHGAGI